MEGRRAREKDGELPPVTTSHAMFYGSSSTMAPPSKSRLKRQSRLFSQVLYRTLSYKDRSSTSAFPDGDDPAELSTQLSAPGILKIFGGNICVGTNYKSVLATGSSGALELVKEALERYGLSQLNAGQYALCDVIGRFEGPEKRWQTEGLRVLGDHEKPLLIQDLWKPREGFSRRLELRRRAEVEEMAARDVDTTTAGINAQARKLQRHRARGAMRVLAGAKRLGTPPALRRSLSESSLGRPRDEELRRRCPALRGPEERSGSSMRYSLYHSPHLLLLQGYSQQHDSLVYLLNREQHTVGQRTQASKPSISLSAPDVLPLHCTIRRLRASWQRSEEKLVLEPIAGASVSVNFSAVTRTVVLRHGDLLSLGLYYLLLYKDPTKAQPLPAQTLLRLRALHPDGPSVCGTCGSLLKERGGLDANRQSPEPGDGPRAPRRRLQLEFEPEVEDVLLRRIMTLIEPGGDDHKLTPAFLLCLCIQHSATSFQPGDFGQLLLKAAKMIQRTVWERTRELAEKQSQHQDPAALSCFTIADLLPDLQHILFWMSNAIEVLYFVQQKSPTYIQSMEEEMDVKGSKESLFSSTITASEEAMTVLEEVIMYTFQQCVYYISKCLYISLPALLECNPFQNECHEGWRAAPPLPEELRRVVLIYQAALDLLRQYEVHPEITSQMFAYLFFFSNTLLFNQLLDKGSSLGCFHWSQGVKLRASMRLLLEWLRGAGFEQLSQQFFAKLTSVANLVAMPGSQLLQMTWPTLRAEFPALSPAQLHRVLSQCQAAMEVGNVAAWQPWDEESTAAFQPGEPPALHAAVTQKLLWINQMGSALQTARVLWVTAVIRGNRSRMALGCEGCKCAQCPAYPSDAAWRHSGAVGQDLPALPSPYLCPADAVLESFDNHPPIVLPSAGFKVDLEVETLDDNIYRHLLYVRHFLWSLQSKSPQGSEGPCSAPPKSEPPIVPEVLEVTPSLVMTPGSTVPPSGRCTPGGCTNLEADEPPPLTSTTNGCPCQHTAGEQQLQEKLQQLQLGRGPAPPAPSCLLTPPTTPLNFDSACPESPQGTTKGLQDPRRNGMSSAKSGSPEGCSPTPYDFPTPESSSRSSATDDFCYVFVVELERGALGLGMGLIDGLHTPLGSPGIYIRTLIEGSPAAADGRLAVGDRILAVNGTSLIGADYQSAVDLIRSGGKKLRFLVAKSDMEIAKKIISSSASS
ncbi:ras-associating and dilute domain-containing protein isoform X1 [Tympanuchus pallidicinctus]|uniref:ras-associating and dilute domain-containing protein isoform X1 n=1 Tax=Tympanuchus pallidicinctus TaxID=109042 RepID=UPI0022876B1E|nr:ras-associating and dilute domain-containing protein isoform X1 [Tympanuchus pallidicinctus]XP_052535520.1 ras-associating and dilute domain-containing protein isoform X1 [Tympanuchus pallidicinctus]